MEKITLTKEQFIEGIKSGNYEVKLENECNCCFDWNIKDGRLVDEGDSDCCWVGHILYVANVPVYQDMQFEAREDLIKGLDVYKLLTEELDRWDIEEAMNTSDSEENEEHTRRKSETLIEWLKESEYKFYIHYPRNFANEYDCILVAPGAEIKEEWTEINPEEWAENYLWNGNASTEAFNGFVLAD